MLDLNQRTKDYEFGRDSVCRGKRTVVVIEEDTVDGEDQVGILANVGLWRTGGPKIAKNWAIVQALIGRLAKSPTTWDRVR